MSENNSSSFGGLGFCSALTLIFITLKLTNYIAWSWWWVLAPLWIPAILIFVFVLLVMWFGNKTANVSGYKKTFRK